MSNIAHKAAGVYVSEIDLSQSVIAAPTSIGAIVGESVKGPVNEATLITSKKDFLNKYGNPNAQVSFMHYCALAFLEQGTRLYVTRVAPNAKYSAAVAKLTNNLNNTLPIGINSGFVDPLEYIFTPDDLFLIYSNNPGVWGNDLTVYVYPNTKLNNNTFYVDVYLKGINQPIESHLVHMNYTIDGFGNQINIEEYINKRSSFIKVIQNKDNAAFVNNPNRQFINTLNVVTLNGGANPTKATSSDIINAWNNYYSNKSKISINLLINSGYTDVAIQRAMVELCEKRADCMAILDTPNDTQRVQDAINWRRNELMLDSNYGALYSPDCYIYDQYNDIRLYVPPSGHVAAAYARTDRDYETWFAPAGMNRGSLDILAVRFKYNQQDRDALYDNQINAARVFSGEGIKLWGADTLQVMGSALSNVSVRRLMMFLEVSLSAAVLYSVFEPNDSVLRTQLTELCTRFLRPIRDARGLYNFDVVCNEDNNPPVVTAAGDLIIDIYLDPVLPTKRIHLNAIVTKTGAKITATGL